VKVFVCVLVLTALAYKLNNHCAAADAIPYVSNLENRWQGGQAPGDIGDIHSVTAYGPTTVAFSTGNQETILRAVTFEFLVAPETIGSWDSVNVALRSSDNTISGQLGGPQLNRMKTQWPKNLFPTIYTQFVDFQPAEATYLPALTEFEIVVSRRPGSPLDGGLLFTKSEAYESMDGWKMGPTTSANPFAAGEFLKFAVHATVVPEPTTFALVCLALVLTYVTRVRTLRN
jgi:hypothetical protein